MSQQKLIPYKVRAIKREEVWVEVPAYSAAHAEQLAAGKPGVISVMHGFTIRADKPAATARQGVEDDSDE
jgi:hypothetical protein